MYRWLSRDQSESIITMEKSSRLSEFTSWISTSSRKRRYFWTSLSPTCFHVITKTGSDFPLTDSVLNLNWGLKNDRTPLKKNDYLTTNKKKRTTTFFFSFWINGKPTQTFDTFAGIFRYVSLGMASMYNSRRVFPESVNPDAENSSKRESNSIGFFFSLSIKS